MLAHLSVLLNLITGFLGGMVALVIYFIYKDRSRFVAYHAMQAFIFQSITWIGAMFVAAVLMIGGFALAFLIIPLLCLIPGFLAILLVPASLVYGVIEVFESAMARISVTGWSETGYVRFLSRSLSTRIC